MAFAGCGFRISKRAGLVQHEGHLPLEKMNRRLARSHPDSTWEALACGELVSRRNKGVKIMAALSLVNDLTGMFSSEALGEAANQLGESEGSVLQGFQTASAAILAGIGNKAGQAGFMKQLFDVISSPFNEGRLLENVRGFFSDRSANGSATANAGPPSQGAGGKMLSMLFGGQQSNVTEEVSRAAGIRPSSASALMSFAAPLVLGLLGRRVREEHLDASGLSNLVQRESSRLSGLLPVGVSRALGMVPAAGAEAVQQVGSAVESSTRWLWPVILLVALIIGLVWFFNRSGREVGRVAGQAASQVRSSAASVGEFFSTTLVNGVQLSIPRNGTEARLVAFVQDPSQLANKETWFDFDRLSFDTGSAVLRPDSGEQLNNIVAILTAYPNLHIKIGGYTDNTGDSQANLALSQARADSVRQDLINRGISENRIEAQGYGEQYPVADNSTEEGRARNRRIALRVTEK